MGIPVAAIADDSVWFGYAYDVSIATVLRQFQSVPGPIYMLMVYNLAGDNLVNWAPDVGTPPYYYPSPPAKPNTPYFAYLRQSMDLTGFVPGVIQSSADESTSESMVVADFFKELQLSDLQHLKTPWGRNYLAWAQKYGTSWGLS